MDFFPAEPRVAVANQLMAQGYFASETVSSWYRGSQELSERSEHVSGGAGGLTDGRNTTLLGWSSAAPQERLVSGALVVLRVELVQNAAAVRQQIAEQLEERAWLLDHAAEEPVRLSVEFRRPVALDDLVQACLADGSEVGFDVTAALSEFKSWPPDRLSAIGLYPSGVAVTLFGRVSREGSHTKFTVPDVLSILDSDGPQPPFIPSGHVVSVDALFFALPVS